MMNALRAAIEPLNKDQIKALKAANDGIVLRHCAGEDWAGSVTALIKTTHYGTPVEARVEVAVSSAIANYEDGRAGEHPLDEAGLAALKLRADHLIHYPLEPGGPWQTIARHLRPGDAIQLYWLRGNHNLTTRESGLAVDEVRLLIQRDGKPFAQFQVGYSVGKKNCARMIRSEAEAHTYL